VEKIQKIGLDPAKLSQKDKSGLLLWDAARLDMRNGQIVGERGGTAFPFRFWRGTAVPLAYTTAVGDWTRGNLAYPRVHPIIL